MATISTNFAAAPTRRGRDGDLLVAVREVEGQECFDLADYRRRYAQYKSDPDLQRAHAAQTCFRPSTTMRSPTIGPTASEDGTTPEAFRFRRAAALQAWYENMPVRRALVPQGAAIAAYRGARYGDLAAFDFLDTRQYRTNQPCDDGISPPARA